MGEQQQTPISCWQRDIVDVPLIIVENDGPVFKKFLPARPLFTTHCASLKEKVLMLGRFSFDHVLIPFICPCSLEVKSYAIEMEEGNLGNPSRMLETL